MDTLRIFFFIREMGLRTLYENNNRIISMSIFLMHFVSFIKKDKARKRKKCIAEIYKNIASRKCLTPNLLILILFNLYLIL